MQALPDADRTKLAKLLGMLGSAHAGERDAAACAADRLVRQRGLSWSDVVNPPALAQPQPPPRQPPPEEDEQPIDWFNDLFLAQRNSDLCSDWERNFLNSISSSRRLSPKQQSCLANIAKKLRARGFT